MSFANQTSLTLDSGQPEHISIRGDGMSELSLHSGFDRLPVYSGRAADDDSDSGSGNSDRLVHDESSMVVTKLDGSESTKFGDSRRNESVPLLKNLQPRV
jgi:hypothetical protein